MSRPPRRSLDHQQHIYEDDILALIDPATPRASDNVFANRLPPPPPPLLLDPYLRSPFDPPTHARWNARPSHPAWGDSRPLEIPGALSSSTRPLLTTEIIELVLSAELPGRRSLPRSRDRSWPALEQGTNSYVRERKTDSSSSSTTDYDPVKHGAKVQVHYTFRGTPDDKIQVLNRLAHQGSHVISINLHCSFADVHDTICDHMAANIVQFLLSGVPAREPGVAIDIDIGSMNVHWDLVSSVQLEAWTEQSHELILKRLRDEEVKFRAENTDTLQVRLKLMMEETGLLGMHGRSPNNSRIISRLREKESKLREEYADTPRPTDVVVEVVIGLKNQTEKKKEGEEQLRAPSQGGKSPSQGPASGA